MLFQQRFQAGIRKGSVTRTYRGWETPRVIVGRQYRLSGGGAVVVDAVESLTLGEIPAADAKRCGFDHKDELLVALRKHTKRKLTARSRVFRVSFHYAETEDPRQARREDTSRASLDEVVLRLDRMDRASRRGPWTREVLALIAGQPRVAASKLAPELGRETRPFKVDVRKLKELGLTISHEVGYSLSKRGRAVLKRL